MTLRRLLLLGPIYSRPTIGGVVSNLLYVTIGVVFISSFVTINSIVITCMVALAILYVVRQAILSYIVQKRFQGAPYNLMAPKGWSLFGQASLSDHMDKADKTDTLAFGDSWQIYDATFNFFRQLRSSQYLSKQVYYTVYEQKLVRSLPHLVFDNKRARGRQFKYRYLGTQKLSLEGNFDDHYETYSPDYYKIDSLSFITPEVMQILIESKDCDIEISGDRLFVYTSLLGLKDIPRLQTYGTRLGAALNDNIDAYRDSYLAGPTRTTATTAFARQLLKSPIRAAVRLTIMTFVLLIFLAYAVTQDPDALVSEVGLYVYVLFGVALYRVYVIERENRDKIAQFEAVRRYTTQNPSRR